MLARKLGASVSLASLSEGDSRTKQLPATYLDLDGFCRACPTHAAAAEGTKKKTKLGDR